MNEVKSYECSFCGKLYHIKGSCRNHEYGCFYNPKTKSCASCAFLRLETADYKPYHQTRFQTCLVNEDISNRKLKCQCSKYLDKKYSEDPDIIKTVLQSYDPIPTFKKVQEKLFELEKDETN